MSCPIDRSSLALPLGSRKQARGGFGLQASPQSLQTPLDLSWLRDIMANERRKVSRCKSDRCTQVHRFAARNVEKEVRRLALGR